MSAPKRKDLKYTVVNGITIYFFPKNKSLYHGTTANTERDPSNYNRLMKKLIKLDDLPTKSRKDIVTEPFYLSNKTGADIYGCNKDSSRVVTALHHSFEDLKERPNRKHIVPIYYVKGEHGVTIEFTSVKDFKLFDLGNLENMKILVSTIRDSKALSKEEKKEYLEALNDTCFTADYNDDYEIIKIKECKRTSTAWVDPTLLTMICSVWTTHLKTLPEIDGWIYFENPNTTFHFEIMLCRPLKLLEYVKTHSVPDTVYDGLPTWDEFRERQPKFKGHKNEIMLTHNITNRIKVDYDKSESISPFFDATQS